MELVTPAATRYGHSDFGRDSQSKVPGAPRLRFERNGRHGLQVRREPERKGKKAAFAGKAGLFTSGEDFDYALDSAFSAVSSASALAFCFSFFSFFFNFEPSNSRMASCAPSPMRKPA